MLFRSEEANDLANVLKSGKMTAKVDIISDMVIGPSLGQQAIESGIMSFIVALVLLMIFMCCIYGVIPGLIANFGLICNLFFTFGILASFQAVLTLSGIAGIVLALGMAVDASNTEPQQKTRLQVIHYIGTRNGHSKESDQYDRTPIFFAKTIEMSLHIHPEP